MAEPRIYVDQDLHEGAVVELPPSAHRHVAVVLKRGRGDRVTLFNGRGGQYGGVIESVDRRTVRVSVSSRSEADRESPLPVTLAQGVSKGERMDFSIQKAVELGVREIQPVLTDHCVVKLSEERWQRKLEHWQGVAISACEQSGRTRVPAVRPPVDLRDWLNGCAPDALKLILTPGAEAVPAAAPPRGRPVVLLIGPEGGFSELEIRLADLAGFVPLALGPRVLRTETAAVVALSVLQALWGDLGTGLKGT